MLYFHFEYCSLCLHQIRLLTIMQLIFPSIIKMSKSPNPKEICRSQKFQNQALRFPRACKLSSVSAFIRRMKKSNTLGQDGRGGGEQSR